MHKTKHTTTTRQAATTKPTTPTLTTRLFELVSACFTGLSIETHEPFLLRPAVLGSLVLVVAIFLNWYFW